MHSRSARPLPLSQRRDLLTLTKRFPQNQTFSLSFRALPRKEPSLFGSARRYLLRGNFSRRWTRVSPTPFAPPLRVGWQTRKSIINRAWEFRLGRNSPRSKRRFPLRFSRALEQKWIVHDVFNARPRPTEIRRTSLRGEENALTFLTGQFFLLNRAKLSASFLVHRFKGNHPFVPRVVRVVIVSMNCPLAHWLEVRW